MKTYDELVNNPYWQGVSLNLIWNPALEARPAWVKHRYGPTPAEAACLVVYPDAAAKSEAFERAKRWMQRGTVGLLMADVSEGIPTPEASEALLRAELPEVETLEEVQRLREVLGEQENPQDTVSSGTAAAAPRSYYQYKILT